jgi:hypothetical protein
MLVINIKHLYLALVEEDIIPLRFAISGLIVLSTLHFNLAKISLDSQNQSPFRNKKNSIIFLVWCGIF